MQGQAAADASALASLNVEIERLKGELAAKGDDLEAERARAKSAQAKAVDFGGWRRWPARRRLGIAGFSVAAALQGTGLFSAGSCSRRRQHASVVVVVCGAARKARMTADEAKAEVVVVKQQLEVAHAERTQAAAQVAALQAEKLRLQQRIAALETELRQAREEAAAAAAAARTRGPAAREQGERKVAEIQAMARTALHQELKKTLQKRKVPEQAEQQAEQPQQAQAPAAQAPQPAKRTRLTPPTEAPAEQQAEPPAAEAEAAAEEPTAMEEEERVEEAEQVRAGSSAATTPACHDLTRASRCQM